MEAYLYSQEIEAAQQLKDDKLESFERPGSKKKGEIASFKFASPAIKAIAVGAVDKHLEELLAAEERAKELGLSCRQQLRASEARRRELNEDRKAWS